MKRDPKPFMSQPVLWHCGPLGNAWMRREQCVRNQERITLAIKGGKNDGEAMDARIRLRECEGCPGVVVRFQQGLEPEPKEIQPLAQLVTNPPAPTAVPTRRSIRQIVDRANPLSRARAPEVPSAPPDGLDVRNLAARKDKGGVIYYERWVNGTRVKVSMNTRDWVEAVALRDQHEATLLRERAPAALPIPPQPETQETSMAGEKCACGCGKPVAKYAGTGRRPSYYSRAHALAHRRGVAPPEKSRSAPEICQRFSCTNPLRGKRSTSLYCSRECADAVAYERKKQRGSPELARALTSLAKVKPAQTSARPEPGSIEALIAGMESRRDQIVADLERTSALREELERVNTALDSLKQARTALAGAA